MLPQALGCVSDGPDGRVELVGNARDQNPQGSHLLLEDDLGLGVLEFPVGLLQLVGGILDLLLEILAVVIIQLLFRFSEVRNHLVEARRKVTQFILARIGYRHLVVSRGDLPRRRSQALQAQQNPAPEHQVEENNRYQQGTRQKRQGVSVDFGELGPQILDRYLERDGALDARTSEHRRDREDLQGIALCLDQFHDWLCLPQGGDDSRIGDLGTHDHFIGANGCQQLAVVVRDLVDLAVIGDVFLDDGADGRHGTRLKLILDVVHDRSREDIGGGQLLGDHVFVEHLPEQQGGRDERHNQGQDQHQDQFGPEA